MLGASCLIVFAASFVIPGFFLLFFMGVPIVGGFAAAATGMMAMVKAVKLAAEGIACLRYR